MTNLATNASLNTKINEVNGEITNITNSATTSPLTAVENKLLILIMANILLLQSLISLRQKYLL